MKPIIIFFAAMLLINVSVPVFADDKAANNMQILLEKIRADKKLIVAENMQLSEKESKAFWPLYEKYQSELYLLRMRTLNLIETYGATYESMDNGTAKKMLDEALEIETLRLKLSKTYLPQFRKILPDIKVARYYQMENKVNAALYYELAANIPLVKAGTP